MCTFIVLVLYTTIEQTNSNLTYLSNIPLIPPAHEARKVATADLFNGVRTSFVTILYFITLNKQYCNIGYLAANFHLYPEIPNVLPQLNPSHPHLNKNKKQFFNCQFLMADIHMSMMQN